MEKLVSVIIPAYNHQNFIKQCIESVINQTYRNLEIIIQDDCSTDNTLKEIKKIKDKRVKVVSSKKNQGIVDTLNDLTKLCHGDYVAVIGSDDIWYPNKIERQVNILKNNPNLGCVFTEADIIDEKGVLYDDEFSNALFLNNNMTWGQRIKLFFERGNYLCHSSSLIPINVIKEIGEYNKTYRQLHDYDYWTRIILKYDIYIINEKLVGYRRLQNNNVSISCVSNKNMIRTFNELYFIQFNMIKNLNDYLFIDAFNCLFKNKNSKTKEEIICEKFFLLLKLGYGGAINKQYALSFMFEHEDKNKIFDVLNKKFSYTLNDFYEETGFFNNLYPISYNEKHNKIINNYLNENNRLKNENNELQNKFRDILNSRSWKITKPIRFISGFVKK